ncbi:WXG100 family type VII secretion target [Streptacidiphilus monticola]|uniref:WXG100 family type VII secretion target n=1 Tax=Streptacidiphilus monticola TaxID=2161674 RepID=A0ABW1GAF7_9ACTN
MAIELPGEVVSFLQFIGVNWPQVNEDKVRELGAHVREFADNIRSTHDEATATVQRIGQSYQGASYEALLAKWGSLSSSHMDELLNACGVVATALDAAADVIVAMKLECIAELAVLAATFVADQAAAVATLGLAEAAEVAIVEAAEKLVDFLTQQLEQYVIGEVIGAAVEPLVGVVSAAVGGLMFQAAENALGVGAGGGAGDGFYVHPDELHAHAEVMHQHAETVAGHAELFRTKLAGVSFE